MSYERNNCSFCSSPFFRDAFVSRYSFCEKNGSKLCYEYRLCKSHWNTEDERIALLFGKGTMYSPVNPLGRGWKRRNGQLNIAIDPYSEASFLPQLPETKVHVPFGRRIVSRIKTLVALGIKIQ